MVRRMQLTYDEIVDLLDVKYIAGSTNGYTILPGVDELSEINLMMKSLLPIKARVKITIDNFRLRSNLTTNKRIKN